MSSDNPQPIDLVDDYVHGLLDDATARRVEDFCEGDEAGRAALAAARERHEALRSLPNVEASESLIRSTLAGVDAKVRAGGTFRRRCLAGLGFVSVASLLVLVGFQRHYSTLEPSPFDVRLVGQRELLAGSRATLRVAVNDVRTGSPVAGVPVQLALFRDKGSDRIDLGEFETDSRGYATPTFELPDWDSGSYQLQVVAETDEPESIAETISLRRAWQVMLSTDKPIYKPGQRIRIRSLALRRPNLKPLADEPATFEITDPKQNVIFRESTSTSRFGICEADCALANEIIEGPYTVSCTIGDTRSEATVEVGPYVLPKFAAKLALDRPFYAPGDRVEATLQTDYFFGKPVAGATVEFVAESEAAGTLRFHEAQVETDESGTATLGFDLPEFFAGREQLSGDASFRLVAIVTDPAGQRNTVAASRLVTTVPVRVEVIPEMGQLVAGVENRVFLFTTTPDGQPLRASVRIGGFDDPFETSELGVGSFELVPEGDTVSLDFTATDVADPTRVATRKVTLEVGGVARDFVLRTDKAVYRGGDTMRIRVLGSGIEPVFVDFLKDGQTQLTKTVDVDQGEGTIEFDLPPDLFGTLQLCAHRLDAGGRPVMKLRTVHIERASDLRIEASFDRESYRPGEEARITFQVRDGDGRPAPGALSLAAVDEAVFHVLKQRPGSEGAFFELDRELLEPVYAIYNGWQPGQSRDLPAERVEFEQAIFARTTRLADDEDAAPSAEDFVVPDDFGMDAELGEGGDFGAEADLGDGVDLGGAVDLGGEAEFGDVELGDPFTMPEGGDPFAEAETASDVLAVERVASPLTLETQSFPDKKKAVEAAQRLGLKRMRSAWRWFVAWVVAAGLIVLALYRPWTALITCCVGVVGFCALLFTRFGGMADEQFADLARMAGAEAAPEMMFGGEAGGLGGMIEALEGVNSELDQQPVRVRQFFPETLLWQPELVTDDEGRAELTVPLADSITTWRLAGSAVSADGRLGALRDGIRVFQPFFVDLDLPVALVRNDEVAVPAVVYNYLDEPQTVELELADGDWFELLADGAAEARFQRLELAPGEVRSVHYRIRAKDVGNHRLQVTARAGDVADALVRTIAVEPDGRRVESVFNGTLDEPRTIELVVPENAIPGSTVAVVKLYPSGFSELVEGLDGILQRPSGCFEQTSSTTYPNILALRYLRETGQAAPRVEQRAREFIHLGYQRLLGFEVRGGGFDWFGNPPANVTLTAYGLMEFEDMAAVHDVDPKLIERTRNWLLSKQEADGSWAAEPGMLNDGLAGSVQRGEDVELATTAYVAWAVFRGPNAPSAAPVLGYLRKHPPGTIDNPYTLALVTNALLAMEPESARPYLARLIGMRKTSEDGKRTWWELGEDRQTQFYGDGKAGDVELTSLATLALIEAKAEPAVSAAALRWLAAQKDGNGTWGTTQATILALQALLSGSAAPLGGDTERSFEVALDGQSLRDWTVAPEQAVVVQQVEVSQSMVAGSHRLVLEETTGTGTAYQVAFRYHVPEVGPAPETEPLSIELSFDRADLAVHESIVATAVVRNNTATVAPMVIADLPIPAGFALDPIDLEELVASGDIAKFDVNARSAVVYLRGLAPGKPLELRYRLQAKMPVKLTVPAALVYEYYDPDVRGRGEPLKLVVTEKS